jgi:hypothetical protein
MQGRINGSSRWIWTRDPAIDGYEDADEKARAISELNEKGGDPDSLKRKNGRQPVVWEFTGLDDDCYTDFTRTAQPEVVRLLARGVASTLMVRATHEERRAAFRRGIVGVQNAKGADGRPLALEFTSDNVGKILSRESTRQVMQLFGPRLIGELGQAIIDASEVDPL